MSQSKGATRQQSGNGQPQQERRKPEAVFGPYATGQSMIEVAVWANVVGEEKRVMHSVTIRRSYLDNQEWKESSSFRAADLAYVKLALDEAFAWIAKERNRK